MAELMIDLETLDTTRTSVVMSVGLVTFMPDGSIVEARTLYPKFEPQVRNMDEESPLPWFKPRTISLDTLRFWLDVAAKDGPAAVNATFVPEADRQQYWEVFMAIEQAAKGREAVWANGDLFDLGILQDMFPHTQGQESWWAYNAPRDLRTLIREVEPLGWTKPAPRDGHAVHSAVDDCVYQVDVLTSIRKFLLSMKVASAPLHD